MSTALSSWVRATIASPINLTANPAVPTVENRPLGGPTQILSSYGRYLLDQLCQEGRLSAAERLRAGIITTEDDSMLPQLPEGARFIAVTVEPAKYQTLVGKVVMVTVKAERFAFYLGRVVEITPNYVRVRRDNSQWSDRIESRLVIAGIARVVSVLETSVN